MNPETVGIMTVEFSPSAPVEYLMDLMDAFESLVGLDMNMRMVRYRVEVGNVTASVYEDISDAIAERIGPDGFTGVQWVPNDGVTAAREVIA